MNKILKWAALVMLAILLLGCQVAARKITTSLPPLKKATATVTPAIVHTETSVPTDTPTPVPTITPTPTATPWVYPTPIYDPEEDAAYGLPPMINFIETAWKDDVEVYVLLGSDYSSWRQSKSMGVDNTDTFIIVIVNYQSGRISLLSLPRDLYVFMPGHGMGRINTAWKRGGEQMLADTIRYNFGLPFNGYAYVRMEAFAQFVDNALHGITVDVRKDLLDQCGDITFNMLPGPHFMDGPTALCYARVRMYDSSFARDTRQREVLLAMKEKFQEIAKDDPVELVLEILKSYSSEHQYISVSVVDILRILPMALDAEIVEFQLDYSWGVTHFDHPVTGAWLLKPPPKECLTTLMYLAVWGDQWIFLPEDWLAETCGVER